MDRVCVVRLSDQEEEQSDTKTYNSISYHKKEEEEAKMKSIEGYNHPLLLYTVNKSSITLLVIPLTG